MIWASLEINPLVISHSNQVWARVALYFDDTRLTNPDTSGATVCRKTNVKKHLKKFGGGPV
jgi:hypothetical protein